MTEENESQAAAAGDEISQGQFGIQKIYVKDISFEVPDSPMVFQQEWSPSVNMDIANSATQIGEGLFEAVLNVTITVSTDDKTMYLVEAQQAGIFQITGLPEDALNKLLSVSCPNILFPFVRELISDIVIRGGFPQLLLSPVNFEALYVQKMQQEAQQQGDGATH